MIPGNRSQEEGNKWEECQHNNRNQIYFGYQSQIKIKDTNNTTNKKTCQRNKRRKLQKQNNGLGWATLIEAKGFTVSKLVSISDTAKGNTFLDLMLLLLGNLSNLMNPRMIHDEGDVL